MEFAQQTAGFLRTLARAETATAEENWGLAALLWADVAAANPVEGWYWSQLGIVRFKNDDLVRAIEAFEQALALRDGYPAETAYRIACCQAALGELDAALASFEQAYSLGLRSLERARTDDRLAALRDLPRFRELTGMIDTSALSRDEGWRVDLHFLAREMKRLAYAPFRYHPESVFDARVAEIELKIPSLSDLQILIEMEKLLVLLGDGHAGVNRPVEEDESRKGLPVQFYLFEEGLFIIAGSAEHRDLLGAEVLAIGDRALVETMTALEPLICRDNEIWLKQTIPHRLRETRVLHALGLIPEDDRATLEIRDANGQKRSIEIVANSRYTRANLQRHFFKPGEWLSLAETLETPAPHYLRNMELYYWFEALPEERIIYAQINRVRDHPSESLLSFTERLMDRAESPDIDRLVLDLRWNPGGNTFLEMPLLHRLIGSKKLNRNGHLFVVIGRATFSAAQNFSTLLDRHTEAIFVGEPTGSSPTFVGETIDFRLPYSQSWANVSDLLWQSGWAMDYRPWVAPLLYAPPTFALFRANRDPAMEAIRAVREHLPGIGMRDRDNPDW
jgi:tetratricopeptide (TPR) repeat protein